MSGKYEKKKRHAKGSRKPVLMLIALMAVVIACVIILLQLEPPAPVAPTQQQPTGVDPTVQGTDPAPSEAPTHEVQIDDVHNAQLDLGNGLVITDIASYAGIYMEDGSDEVVSGVLMIVVTNQGENPLQYAQITLNTGKETAAFALSTLPVGESMVVLEQNRMRYDAQAEYADAAAQNVVWFDDGLSLCEDRLQIQSLDGAINLTNISGEDITDDIVIYYKNSAADVYYGGITYRVRLTGGLKAGEVRQIISDHYSASGSTIMFVTCG